MQSRTLTMLYVILMTITAVPADAISIATGLISHYKLDGSSDPVIDSAGSNDGTNNGATPGQPGVDVGPGFGNSFYFDSSSSISFIEGPFSGTTDFSIFAWVKTSLSGDRREIFTFGESLSGQGGHLYMGADDNLHFDLSQTFGPSSSVTINDGNWHSVGVIYTGGAAQLYVDGGTSGASQSLSPNIILGDQQIGSDKFGNRKWIGLIDDIGIWNRGLTEPNINFISANPIPEPSTALLLSLGLVGLAARRRPAG